ncbi:hypothetical protein AB0J40_08645 [Amycolatopsis sp. NPDC049691]|uniref:hypothetical protein n=1 Tax=Amycolatopsis sp. NPDC049691 TaxID=3155155 RepID=UPI00344656D7
MLKKAFFVTAALGAGAFMVGGVASADTISQVSLLNLEDTDVLHNVDGTVGFCDNEVNVLGVQVPVHDVANGVGVGEGESPSNCAGGGSADGGTVHGN